MRRDLREGIAMTVSRRFEASGRFEGAGLQSRTLLAGFSAAARPREECV
jgi:hypothetical protein